jgi:hypothetical protein
MYALRLSLVGPAFRPASCVLALALGAVAAVSTGCDRASPSSRKVVTVTRPAGSWQGRGNSTLGFVSDSGRLRITWEARGEAPPGSGSLRVTVHSAVSGRPLKVVVDHRGDGGGVVTFDDDPRAYNLMVESANLEWSISVDEFVGVYQDGK